MMRLLLFLTVFIVAAGPALAEPIELSLAWARASPGAAKNGVAYLTVTNHGADTAIVGAETGAADHASLHTHIMDGDIMRMRPVDRIPVANGETVTFEPGGLHIMLMKLGKPLSEGDTFALTLILEDKSAHTVDVAVGSVGAMSAPGHEMSNGEMSGEDMPDKDEMEDGHHGHQ
jgi:hypothetical protein